jgi:hypothetical protein
MFLQALYNSKPPIWQLIDLPVLGLVGDPLCLYYIELPNRGCMIPLCISKSYTYPTPVNKAKPRMCSFDWKLFSLTTFPSCPCSLFLCLFFASSWRAGCVMWVWGRWDGACHACLWCLMVNRHDAIMDNDNGS